jgi:hypothetical protein
MNIPCPIAPVLGAAGLACVLAPLAPARAQDPLLLISTTRWVQGHASAWDDIDLDGDSGEELSYLYGTFDHDLGYTGSVANANASSSTSMTSFIDVTQAHVVSSIYADASVGAGPSGGVGASSLAEFCLDFTITAGAGPFTVTGSFFASDSVTGNCYLQDNTGGTGILFSVNAPSSLVTLGPVELPPGENYTLYARVNVSLGFDAFMPGSGSGSGTFHFDLVPLSGPVAAAEAAPRPGSRLEVWPNPFRERATLSVGGAVPDGRLLVHDLRGRIVRQLEVAPGGSSASWDGRDQRGRALPAGVYFLRLAGGGSGEARKVTLLR